MEITTKKLNWKEVLLIPEATMKYIGKSNNFRVNGVFFYEGYMYISDGAFAFRRKIESGEDGKKLTLAGEFEEDTDGMGKAIKGAFDKQLEYKKAGDIKLSVEKLSHLLAIAKLQGITDITISLPENEGGAMVMKQNDRDYLLMGITK